MQEDFGVFFHTESDKPVRYASRPFSANCRHDLIYLSSYLHDAEFRMDEVQCHRRTVTIKLNRARWELWRKLNELIFIPSELTIRSVKSMRIELGAEYHFTRKFLRKPDLRIFSLRLFPVRPGRDTDDDSDDEVVVIDCTFAWLRLRVSDRYKILLVDKPKANANSPH
jgi:hypothetical protein